MNKTLRQKICTFLTSIPNIDDSRVRKALIYRASLDSSLIDLIEFAGASEPFVQILVPMLEKYGELEDGQYALVAVLEAAKHYVGQDKKAYCDYLEEELHQEFFTAMLGYDNWRQRQNSWLLEKFQSQSESRAAFNQVINVLDPSAWRIERERINTKLENWLRVRWPNKQEFVALLGEEGDGKTWAVASWIARMLKTDPDFPAVLFLTSNALPATREPQELLAHAIALQLRELDIHYWEKRVWNWMQRTLGELPQIVLVLDGINERHDVEYWRSVLEKLNVPPWKNQIGVILTCRNIPWKHSYASLSHLAVQSLTIPPFCDDELTAALSLHEMRLSGIEPDLLPLIRKPRYLDLTLQHYQVMVESGDPTVERLLYEDWKDRFRRKSGMKLTHAQFHELIRVLAEKTLAGSRSFSQRDIEDVLPSNARQVVDEVISGGILISDPVRKVNYVVEPQRLVHGFGLLLKQEIHEALLSNLPVQECIAKLVDPQRDMDLKVKIYGAAVVHAIMDDEYPEEGKYLLLRLWVESRNLNEDAQGNFTAYLPCCPQIYVRLAEHLWSDQYNNPFAQTLLMRGFLKWRKSPTVQTLLSATCERWMGFLHPYGFIFQRGKTLEETEKLREEIESRVGIQLQPGPISFHGYDLTVVEDDGLLRLAKVVLAIISLSPRRPFLHALVKWSLSRAIMGRPDEYELVSWTLKTVREDLWEPFKAEIERLIALDETVTKQAAFRLLSCLGSQKAYRLQSRLPDDLFPPHPLQEMYAQDPCSQGFYHWSREHYLNCLQRTDLEPFHVALKMKELALEPGLPVPADFGERLTSLLGEDFSPEGFWKSLSQTSDDHQLNEAETALAAFAPEILAKIFRNIIRDAPNRRDIALKQLALRVERNLLVLRKEERKIIEQVWKRLITQWKALNGSERKAEYDIFPAILADLPAREQVEALLARPDEALDLVQYRYLFRPLAPQDAEDLLQDPSNANNPRRLQRILWFLFVNPIPLSASVSKQLAAFLTHEETETRRFVLELMYKSQDEEAIRSVINSTWGWHPDHWFKEDQWGSLLLSNFGASLSYQEIRMRVHPVYWGYAVEKRGLIDAEVRQYAEDIHSVWQHIKEKGISLPENFPDTEVRYHNEQETPLFDTIGISTDFLDTSFTLGLDYSSWGGTPPSENSDDGPNALIHQHFNDTLKQRSDLLEKVLRQQAVTGNDWFAKQFLSHSLKQVLAARPDLVQQWLQAVDEETKTTSRLLWLCGSFYETLLKVLFDEKPEDALKLWRRLDSLSGGIHFIDSNTGLRIMEKALFQCPAHAHVQPVWQERLENCSNDLELFELALIAQHTGNTPWVKALIQEGGNSPWQFEQARAMTLLGFLEDSESEAILQQYNDMPQCWTQKVAKKALQHCKRNLWAKQWFQRFLEDDDTVRAWACFKLFLKCVDRRFSIWESEFVNEESLKNRQIEERVRFLHLNQNELQNHIKENEKKRTETFLGEKVLKDKIWPWMNV